MRFFDKSNFKGWPEKIDSVVYHWGNDKKRFIKEVKRKKIEVLIGNIPATAYETFREISRELPKVRFIPSLDTQFSNKSKENVTHFCEKYELPIPKTDIFYEKEEAMAFLEKAEFPRIIKKSYGPSNYGGYFVHKVDSFDEAKELLEQKRYYPIYVQEFVPMQADIRVMVVGHKPMCAFWRRAPEGEWLTNTSQGGSMDYQNVPQEALDIAVKASKAANAEYWACDIALGYDGKFRILECATAFAAFPYIRDWIGQYLMWDLSGGKLKDPYFPHYNWEELGKIRSSVLRTMRHITFGEYTPSYDCADSLEFVNREDYPMLPMELRPGEEWPSEIWNRQDNYIPLAKQAKVEDLHLEHQDIGLEDAESPVAGETLEAPPETKPEADASASSSSLSREQVLNFLADVKGVGPKMQEAIIDELGVDGVNDALSSNPEKFLEVKNLKQKKLDIIMESWEQFKVTL